jgi:outer membrane protein insertion porin family
VLLLPILAAAAGADQQTKVIDLRVQGNKRMSAEAVLASVKSRLGQDYDQSVVEGDRQRLLETGQFDSVIVTKTQTDKGVIVTFIVTERPLVTKLAFIGNKAFKDKELAKELPFNESDPLTRFNVNAGRDAILSKYKNAGFYKVVVKVDWAALDKEKRAVYHIVEGPGVAIRKVAFEGNRHFRNLRLRRVVSTKARVWPFIAGRLDLEQVDGDVISLRNFYVSEGFLDCEVGRTLEFSYDKKKVTVRFVIKEGGRYRVNQVIFKGNTVFSDEELARRLKLKRGENFTSISLRRDITQLEETYGELGYIEASVKARRQFLSPETPVPPWAAVLGEIRPSLLNVVFTITEADRYRFGRLDIRGNKITQSRIIRRGLRFFPEQDWNTKAVEESRHRLLETRLFEDVTITAVKTDRPNVRDVVVTVEEGKTAEFLVGVGLNTNRGVLGTVSFTQRNFDLFA